MRALLLLLLLLATPVALRAQSIDALRAGPALHAGARPWRATDAPGPRCDFSRRERVVGGALLGAGVGAGIGYVFSIMLLQPDARGRAASGGAAIGAAFGAILGAHSTCPKARPGPVPPWLPVRS